jgi:hypothetical protein
MKLTGKTIVTSYIFLPLNWDKRCEMDFQIRIQLTVQTCNFGLTIEIYHDARPYKRQIPQLSRDITKIIRS